MISRKLKMKNKLLIFDLDGTIADTLDTIRNAVNMCVEHFGFEKQTYGQVRRNVGNGVSYLMKHSLPEHVSADEARFAEILEYFRSCYLLTHDKLDGCYEGLYEVIVALHASGYKLAVLSNKPDRLVKNIIKKLFPDGTFSISMGQTELPRKPDPTVPLMIANELGFELDCCYYIGDSEVDVQTAKNAGMHSVAVSWGFRDRALLEEALPERIIDTPQELLAFFEKA